MLSTRLIEETGCIMAGGFETLGKAATLISRSCTICRARNRFVPGWNSSTIDDRPLIDEDRFAWSHGKPARNSSSGTVIRASTSPAGRPAASVWISTNVGENSGTRSTVLPVIDAAPNIINTTTAKTTNRGYRWLVSRIDLSILPSILVFGHSNGSIEELYLRSLIKKGSSSTLLRRSLCQFSSVAVMYIR